MRTMYDAVDPNAIPRDAQMVAGYLDGSESKWPDEAWGWWPNAVMVHIVVDPANDAGEVLDVETGNGTAAQSVAWTVNRRASGLAHPTVYCGSWAPGYTWSDVISAHLALNISPPLIWYANYDGGAIIPDGAIAKQYFAGAYGMSAVADYWPGVDPVAVTVEEARKYAADATARTNTAIENLQMALESLKF